MSEHTYGLVEMITVINVCDTGCLCAPHIRSHSKPETLDAVDQEEKHTHFHTYPYGPVAL